MLWPTDLELPVILLSSKQIKQLVNIKMVDSLLLILLSNWLVKSQRPLPLENYHSHFHQRKELLISSLDSFHLSSKTTTSNISQVASLMLMALDKHSEVSLLVSKPRTSLEPSLNLDSYSKASKMILLHAKNQRLIPLEFKNGS